MFKFNLRSPQGVLLTPVRDETEVEQVVFVTEERLLPAVSAQGNMMRHSRDNNTCKSGHVLNLSEHPTHVKKYVWCPRKLVPGN